MNNNSTKLVFLTAYRGNYDDFLSTYRSLATQLAESDFWIIALDGVPVTEFQTLEKPNIRFISSNKLVVAGAARNLGLDFLFKHNFEKFFLIPFDGDDRYKPGALLSMRKCLALEKAKIVVFGQERVRAGRKSDFFMKTGSFSYISQLFQYNMPVGVSCVFVETKDELQKFRFGLRKRANDHNFFLGVIKWSQYGLFQDQIVHEYVISSTSLSGQKWRMVYFKAMALRDHGLNWPLILLLLPAYMLTGVLRHVLCLNV